MGLMELLGDPYERALEPAIVAPDPLNWKQLCAPYHPGQNVNVKPGGMARGERDSLRWCHLQLVQLDWPHERLGAPLADLDSAVTYGRDSTLFVRQHDLAGFVAASSDNGSTWANVTSVGAFPGRFSAPTFTNCGPGSALPRSRLQLVVDMCVFIAARACFCLFRLPGSLCVLSADVFFHWLSFQ